MCIKTNLYTCFANCVIHGLVRKSKDNSIGTFVYPIYIIDLAPLLKCL